MDVEAERRDSRTLEGILAVPESQPVGLEATQNRSYAGMPLQWNLKPRSDGTRPMNSARCAQYVAHSLDHASSTKIECSSVTLTGLGGTKPYSPGFP